jgi:ABC-2 type transport system ATP-binding protein
LLEVQNLTKQYKRFKALDQLSFRIAPGEIVGLLGPNGAGKTTALRCISGILRPNLGNILVNGHDIVTNQKEAKAGLAFVPEVPALYELLTVEEHIRFVAMCFDTVDVYESMVETLLDRYSLKPKKEELVATLSKGMRQKLAVACALVHRANVFLLDEPLIGIDPEGAKQLKDELLRAKNDGASILISTHLLDTAEKLCDRVIILQNGKMRAEGTLADLQRMTGHEGMNLEEIFLSITSGAP